MMDRKEETQDTVYHNIMVHTPTSRISNKKKWILKHSDSPDKTSPLPLMGVVADNRLNRLSSTNTNHERIDTGSTSVNKNKNTSSEQQGDTNRGYHLKDRDYEIDDVIENCEKTMLCGNEKTTAHIYFSAENEFDEKNRTIDRLSGDKICKSLDMYTGQNGHPVDENERRDGYLIEHVEKTGIHAGEERIDGIDRLFQFQRGESRGYDIEGSNSYTQQTESNRNNLNGNASVNSPNPDRYRGFIKETMHFHSLSPTYSAPLSSRQPRGKITTTESSVSAETATQKIQSRRGSKSAAKKPPPLSLSPLLRLTPVWKEGVIARDDDDVVGLLHQNITIRKTDRDHPSGVESPSVQSEINSWNAKDFTSTSTPRPKEPRFAQQRFFAETPIRPRDEQDVQAMNGQTNGHRTSAQPSPVTTHPTPPSAHPNGNPAIPSHTFPIFNHFEMPLRPIRNLLKDNRRTHQSSTQPLSAHTHPMNIQIKLNQINENNPNFGFGQFVETKFSRRPARNIYSNNAKGLMSDRGRLCPVPTPKEHIRLSENDYPNAQEHDDHRSRNYGVCQNLRTNPHENNGPAAMPNNVVNTPPLCRGTKHIDNIKCADGVRETPTQRATSCTPIERSPKQCSRNSPENRRHDRPMSEDRNLSIVKRSQPLPLSFPRSAPANNQNNNAGNMRHKFKHMTPVNLFAKSSYRSEDSLYMGKEQSNTNSNRAELPTLTTKSWSRKNPAREQLPMEFSDASFEGHHGGNSDSQPTEPLQVRRMSFPIVPSNDNGVVKGRCHMKWKEWSRGGRTSKYARRTTHGPNNLPTQRDDLSNKNPEESIDRSNNFGSVSFKSDFYNIQQHRNDNKNESNSENTSIHVSNIRRISMGMFGNTNQVSHEPNNLTSAKYTRENIGSIDSFASPLEPKKYEEQNTRAASDSRAPKPQSSFKPQHALTNSNSDVLNASNLRRVSFDMFSLEKRKIEKISCLNGPRESKINDSRQSVDHPDSFDNATNSCDNAQHSPVSIDDYGQEQRLRKRQKENPSKLNPHMLLNTRTKDQKECKIWTSCPGEQSGSRNYKRCHDELPALSLVHTLPIQNDLSDARSRAMLAPLNESCHQKDECDEFVPAEVFFSNVENESDLKIRQLAWAESKVPASHHRHSVVSHVRTRRADAKWGGLFPPRPPMRRMSHPVRLRAEKSVQDESNREFPPKDQRRLTQETIRERLNYRRESLRFDPISGYNAGIRHRTSNDVSVTNRPLTLTQSLKTNKHRYCINDNDEAGELKLHEAIHGNLGSNREPTEIKISKPGWLLGEKRRNLDFEPLLLPSSHQCDNTIHKRGTTVEISQRLGSNETLSSGYLSLDRNYQKTATRSLRTISTHQNIKSFEVSGIVDIHSKCDKPRSKIGSEIPITPSDRRITIPKQATKPDDEETYGQGESKQKMLGCDDEDRRSMLVGEPDNLMNDRRDMEMENKNGRILTAMDLNTLGSNSNPEETSFGSANARDLDASGTGNRDGISVRCCPRVVLEGEGSDHRDQRPSAVRCCREEKEGNESCREDDGKGVDNDWTWGSFGIAATEEGEERRGGVRNRSEAEVPTVEEPTMNSSDTECLPSKPAAAVPAVPVPSYSSSHNRQSHEQQQQIHLDGSIKTYGGDDNFFQELEKDFGQLPQFPSPLGQAEAEHKGRKSDRNSDRGRAPYTSTLEHKHKHSDLSAYDRYQSASSAAPSSHQPSKTYNQEFSSLPNHHNHHHLYHHHNQPKPHHQQQSTQSHQSDHNRKHPQNSSKTSFSSHSNCSSLRSDSHYSGSYNNNRHSPASRQNSFNSKPQSQVNSKSSNHQHHRHHHQFMSSPSSSSSHHRRDDIDITKGENNPLLKGSETIGHHNFTPVHSNDPSVSSAILNQEENSDKNHPLSSKHHQNIFENYTSNTNTFGSPELSVFTGNGPSSHEQSRHKNNPTSRASSKSTDREANTKSSRQRQHSDGFIPTQSSSTRDYRNHNQNFENDIIDDRTRHHHHNHHHHDHHVSSNSDSEQAERTLRRKDVDRWAKKMDKNNDSDGVLGGGSGGVHHHTQNHWPETNYSYSDNEKQLLEEMRRMKKEHQNVLRTYEGRVNKLMAKMHELRNIAEMLENSSTKTSPFGILPGKLALLNILGENGEDDSKKGAKGEGMDGGGPHIPPPLPPRPLRGSRVYPNKPIIHPNVAMRNLPWDRIILDGAVPSEVLWKDTVETDMDREELERLFSGAEDVNPSMNLYEDICHRRGSAQIQPVRFYEAEHSQRIHSELCNLNCNLQDVTKAFMTLNPAELHIDSFAELLELLTSHRDIDKIIHHGKRKGSSQLDVPEYLVFELSKIDHFKERLEFLRFKNKLQINLFEIDQQLKELHIACDEISSSLPLKRVLETVLAVGNYMNGGTEKGQADGYRIEILTSLKYLQDKNKRGNLLELIMKIYCQKHESDQDFGCPTHFRLPEPSNMRHAAQVSFEDIQRALKELKDELTFVMNKLESLSKRQTTITMSLRVTTENFFTSAVEVLAEEQKLLEDTKVHFTKTTTFFSHSEHPTSPKEFFQLWASFLHDCKYYWKQAHRNLARAKFTDDLAMKNQMSSSSLPGFNNLKSVMMKHVVSFQQHEEEMDESKAQQLQHISSWIESIGRYAMEMQPEESDGLAGGLPNLQQEENTNEFPSLSQQHNYLLHEQHRQPAQNQHGSHGHRDSNKHNRPQSPSYVNSAMYQSDRQNLMNQPDVVPPSDHHHHHYHRHHGPASPKPLSAIPPNVHKPQPISHTSPTISSPSSSSPNLPIRVANPPLISLLSERREFIDNNKDESDDNFGFSSPPPPIRPPPIPPQLNVRQDLTPEMLIPDKSMDVQSPTSPTGTSSHSKKNQNFFKAFLKKDQKKSTSHNHENGTTTAMEGGINSQTPTSKAAVTPFNKLKNTFVQKLSGSGSSKKATEGKSENNSNNTNNRAQNFSPVEYSQDNTTRQVQQQQEQQQQQESLNAFQQQQQEYEPPQFQSHRMIRSELDKLNMKNDAGGPDYQNCHPHQPSDMESDNELMRQSERMNNNDLASNDCPDGNAMNTISRYQDQVSSMYGFRQLGTDNDLRKSSDQLNELLDSTPRNDIRNHQATSSKPKVEVSPSTSNKSGPPRLRAPIALGSNISISDVFGNSGDTREQENVNIERLVEPQSQKQHVAPQIRTPKIAAVPTSSDPKLVRADAVPVYKAKLIPNYENQTKLDPRVDFGAIRGQAEPVRVPPVNNGKSKKEIYKMQLQKQSERYVSGGSHSTSTGTGYSQAGPHHRNSDGGISAINAAAAASGGPPGAPTTYTVMPSKPNHHYMSPFQVPPLKQQQQQNQMIPPSHSSPHLYQQEQQQQRHPHDHHNDKRDLNHNFEHKDDFIASSLKLQNQTQKTNSKGHDNYENTPVDTPSKPASDSNSSKNPGRRSTSAHNLLSGNLKEQLDYQSDQSSKGHVSRRDASEVRATHTTRRAMSQGRLQPSSETVTSLIDRFEKKQPTPNELLNLLDVSEKPPSMTSTPVTRRKNAGSSNSNKMTPYDINGNLSNTSNSDVDSQSQRSKSRSNQERQNNANERNLNEHFASFGTPSQVVLPFNLQQNTEHFADSMPVHHDDGLRNNVQPEFEAVISGSSHIMQQQHQQSSSPSSSSSSRPKASSSSLDRGRQSKPISSTPQNFHHHRESPLSRRDNIPGPQQSLSPTSCSSQARTPSDRTRSDLDQGGRSSSSQRSIHSSVDNPSNKAQHRQHGTPSNNHQQYKNNLSSSANFQSPYLPKPEPQYPLSSSAAAPIPLSSSSSAGNHHHTSTATTPNQRLIQPHVSTSQQNLSVNLNLNHSHKKSSPINLIHSSKSQNQKHSQPQTQQLQHQNGPQDNAQGYNSWPSSSSSPHSQQQQQQQQQHRSRRDLDMSQPQQQQHASDVGNYPQQLRRAYQSNNTPSSAFERPLRPTHNLIATSGNNDDNNGSSGNRVSGQRGNTAIVKPTVMHL